MIEDRDKMIQLCSSTTSRMLGLVLAKTLGEDIDTLINIIFPTTIVFGETEKQIEGYGYSRVGRYSYAHTTRYTTVKNTIIKFDFTDLKLDFKISKYIYRAEGRMKPYYKISVTNSRSVTIHFRELLYNKFLSCEQCIAIVLRFCLKAFKSKLKRTWDTIEI